MHWGDRHYEGGFHTCGTRKIVTRVADVRGYPLTTAEKHCAENCDRYYHCFAQRSRVGEQTWEGVTEYFGDCADVIRTRRAHTRDPMRERSLPVSCVRWHCADPAIKSPTL